MTSLLDAIMQEVSGERLSQAMPSCYQLVDLYDCTLGAVNKNTHDTRQVPQEQLTVVYSLSIQIVQQGVILQ